MLRLKTLKRQECTPQVAWRTTCINLRGPNHYTKGIPCSINPPLHLLVHSVHMYRHRPLCTASLLPFHSEFSVACCLILPPTSLSAPQPLVAPIPTSLYYLNFSFLHLNPVSRFPSCISSPPPCASVPSAHISFLMNTYQQRLSNPLLLHHQPFCIQTF